MFCESGIQIFGEADVESIVHAPYDVRVCHRDDDGIGDSRNTREIVPFDSRSTRVVCPLAHGRSGHSPCHVARHERTLRFAEGEAQGESNGGGGSRTRLAAFF